MVQEPFYVFTRPEGASDCEVYNFSVIANYSYAGAIYTGAGCHIHSPVLSMMLPSLPDIQDLESSLSYSLKKLLTGRVLLTVSHSVSCSLCVMIGDSNSFGLHNIMSLLYKCSQQNIVMATQ